MVDETPGTLNPTDKNILNTLSNQKRQTAKNLATIHNGNQEYYRNRARKLKDKGYAEDPGPADRSGMIQASPAGLTAAHRLNKYLKSHADTFRDLCMRVEHAQTDRDRNEFDPTLIDITELEERVARELITAPGVTIASELASNDEFKNHGTDGLAAALHALYFFNLAERKEGMDVYTISNTGKQYFNTAPEHPDEPDD